MRIETGPVRFKGDWTGIFIRGDNAFHYAQTIDLIQKFVKDERLKNFFITLEGLKKLLESCDERNVEEIQELKSFEECKLLEEDK